MESEALAGRGHAGAGTKQQSDSRTSDAAQAAREKAGEAASMAQDRAEEQAAGQKERASDQLDSFGSALRDTSQSLRRENQEAVAGYVDSAASQVERLSDYLSNRTVGELMSEAQGIARREPALFLGGAFLLGLVGGRFMRSSERHGHYTDGYDSDLSIGDGHDAW